MRLGQGEDGEAFGDVFLRPVGEPGIALAIAVNQLFQPGFSFGDIFRIPDRPQLSTNAFPGPGGGGVMDGVLSEMEPAAPPCAAARHSATGGVETGVAIRDDGYDPAHTARDQRFEKFAPMDLGL